MPKYNTKRFIYTFLVSFCLLLVPYLITLFTFSGTNRAVVRSPASKDNEVFVGEDFSLFTGLMSDTKTLSGLFLVHCSPQSKEITLCNIPLQFQLDYNGSLWRMDELISSVGIKGLYSVLSDMLEQEDPRYAMFNIDGMIKLIDSIGRIEYTLPVPILTQNGTTALEVGKQQLDGRRISLILSSTEFANASAIGLVRTAELYRSGIAYRLPHLTISGMELLFNITANNSINNLSYQDYHNLKPGIEHLISPDTKIIIYKLDGQYSGDRGSFIPTKESLEYLKSLAKSD